MLEGTHLSCGTVSTMAPSSVITPINLNSGGKIFSLTARVGELNFLAHLDSEVGSGE